MRLSFEDGQGQTGGVRTNVVGTLLQTLMGPAGIAAGCLAKDREALLAFYDFPAEHWEHIRTGNPIESALPLSDIARRAPKAPQL